MFNSLFARHQDQDDIPPRPKHMTGGRPDPLPRRKRALTAPSPLSQDQSAFFSRLPPEIRHQIYRELLAPADRPELHVASGDGRLLSQRCRFNYESPLPSWNHLECWGSTWNHDGTMPRISDRSVPRKKGKERFTEYHTPQFESCYPRPIRVAILQSCRRMYVDFYLGLRLCPLLILIYIDTWRLLMFSIPKIS